ncbi:MAG TPA: adenylate kinase [Firmicutes bacterium]|jgi:adenylate kinase|nr:adenylate kinase [Bacillota bacterium]HAA34604.1 adenylate kinase [Bacillota bacterium]
MFVIIMGPPCAGKGTQAERLAKEFALPHISTGDIFRSAVKEGTEMGKKAKEYMDKGHLVPDEIVVGIVKERLSRPDCKEGAFLDGFPRTVNQAEALDEVLRELDMKIDAVICIDADEDALIARLTGRRVCRNCGATYHIRFNPPQVRNICDHCSGELYQRSDDSIDTVKERFAIYKKQTLPMFDYYRGKYPVININGSKQIDEVYDAVISSLKDICKLKEF